MADNFTSEESGTGKEIATDERSIGGITVDIQRVVNIGDSTWDAGTDATVTTSAESIAARETRSYILFTTPTTNTANVLVGTTGDEVFPIAAGGVLTLPITAAVFYKSASGTQTLNWIEVWS